MKKLFATTAAYLAVTLTRLKPAQPKVRVHAGVAYVEERQHGAPLEPQVHRAFR